MRGGPTSTAALVAAPVAIRRQRPRHCPDREYAEFVGGQDGFNPHYLNAKLRYYRSFRDRWPDLAGWFAASLAERVGRLPGKSFQRPASPRTGPGPT